MRKLILTLAALWLATLPAVAQITLPGHYKYDWRQESKFYKTAVFKMGKTNSAAAGGQDGLLGGTLYRLSAPASSVTSGATTVGLALPANTLVTTAHAVRMRVSGRCAANANAKTINVLWGSTTIAVLSAVASNAKDFYVDVAVYRTGASAQQITVAGYANGALLDNLSVSSTQAETAAINFQVSVPTSTSAADVVINDVTILGESG